MATTVDTADRLSAERRFYTRMALLLLVIVFLGFAPSFYLRGLVTVPRPNPTLPPWVMLHGLLFSLWMLLLVAQTQLVSAGRRDLHMKLGGAGVILALALIPLMYLTSVWQVARANQPPFTDPLNWTIVPLAPIPAFAALVWVGWSRRLQPQTHKRAMLCAALMMSDPAFGRLPFAPPTLAGFAFTNLLALATFIPLIVWDRRTLGKVHPVTLLGLSLFAIALLVRLAFLATGSWAAIAQRLPGI